MYIVIASPRPIWAHISRARSILYIKGFPTHYWTRLLGANFKILPQNPVCLGPLTAQLAACMAMIARIHYNSVQKHSLFQKGFGIRTRSCFFRDAPGYWVLRFTLLVTKPTLSHIRPKGQRNSGMNSGARGAFWLPWGSWVAVWPKLLGASWRLFSPL